MTRARTVMIVDDDADCRAVLAEVLEGEGCTVYPAENGQQALDLLRHVHPDLLLVDLMMPVMNGWDFCARLDLDDALADISVTILSVVGGMAPFNRPSVLMKPIALRTLIGLLDVVDEPPPSRPSAEASKG